MPTGLAALGHQDSRTGIQSLARLVERLHLCDEWDAGGVDAVGERLQITERQHDRRPLPLQSVIPQVGLAGQTPGDETASNPRPLGQAEFALQPVRVAVAATDEAQA